MASRALSGGGVAVGRVAVAALSALLVSCASGAPRPAPAVAVGGPANEVTALAGEWSGQYWSPVTGRSGCIHFRLAADDDAAWGDVTMFPAAMQMQHRGAGETIAGAGSRQAAQQLTIRFVRVAAGRVSGTLDPYQDPDCGCLLSTTFEGQLDGDVVAGEYVARAGGTHPQTTGSWRVQRVRDGEEACPAEPAPQRP